MPTIAELTWDDIKGKRFRLTGSKEDQVNRLAGYVSSYYSKYLPEDRARIYGAAGIVWLELQLFRKPEVIISKLVSGSKKDTSPEDLDIVEEWLTELIGIWLGHGWIKEDKR